MSATRSLPLTALALAVGLMAHGTTPAQDHSQHQMPAMQDHSQHQPAKKPVAKKKAKAPVAATKAASTGHAGHAGHSTPSAAKASAKAVAKPAKKKAAAPATAPHAGHRSAPVATPTSKPEATRQAPDPHAGMDHDATVAPMTEMDHAAMGHTMPVAPAPAAGMDKDAPVAPMADMDHAAMGHTMPMAPAPATAMDHAAMGHGTPVAPDQPLTPIPALTDADRAAAFPDLQRHMEHAPEVNSYVLFNRLEAWDADPGTGQAWEALAWIGTDLDRVWLRSEGERAGGHTEAADLEVLYGRSVSPWWDVVAGIRHDFQPGPSQTWAAFGVQGLSPYKFEVQATAYVGESGQTAANFEAEYETLLTNRLILQPLVEINLYGKDDPRRGIGSGLSTVEAGLRLRYEITRRFAPYIGVVHERAYGGTADFRRSEGEDSNDTRVVAGVRIWF
jgi:copper resistance protein B